MNEFRTGSSRYFITSCVTVAQLDVAAVSLAVQYDVPLQYHYLLERLVINKEFHKKFLRILRNIRCGRSGRFGRKGVNIIFTKKEDNLRIHELEEFYNIFIEELPANIADII